MGGLAGNRTYHNRHGYFPQNVTGCMEAQASNWRRPAIFASATLRRPLRALHSWYRALKKRARRLRLPIGCRLTSLHPTSTLENHVQLTFRGIRKIRSLAALFVGILIGTANTISAAELSTDDSEEVLVEGEVIWADEFKFAVRYSSRIYLCAMDRAGPPVDRRADPVCWNTESSSSPSLAEQSLSIEDAQEQCQSSELKDGIPIPESSIQRLKNNPDAAPAFDEVYGQGTAACVLGTAP